MQIIEKYFLNTTLMEWKFTYWSNEVALLYWSATSWHTPSTVGDNKNFGRAFLKGRGCGGSRGQSPYPAGRMLLYL